MKKKPEEWNNWETSIQGIVSGILVKPLEFSQAILIKYLLTSRANFLKKLRYSSFDKYMDVSVIEKYQNKRRRLASQPIGNFEKYTFSILVIEVCFSQLQCSIPDLELAETRSFWNLEKSGFESDRPCRLPSSLCCFGERPPIAFATSVQIWRRRIFSCSNFYQ